MTIGDLFPTGEQPPHTQRGPKCTVGKILDQADPEGRDRFQAILDSDWRGTEIAARLRQGDIRVSPATIQRHRRGQCACDVTRKESQ